MAQFTAVTPTITASGTTWAQLKTGGVKIVLDKMAAANAAKSNPTTQATATATGGGATGGSLAAGTYYLAYTWVDAFGETTIGTSESAQLTVSATNIPRITIPSLPTGCQCANIYITPVGGASGTEQLYATGITGTTFDLSYAAPSLQPGDAVPASNTTGWNSVASQINSLVMGGASERTLYDMSEWLSNYLRGDGMPLRAVHHGIVRRTGILKAWYTVMSEIYTLIEANAPAASVSTNGVGIPTYKWTMA